MRRALLLITVSGALLSLGYLAEGLRYSRGTWAQPGAGVYPLLVGAVLLIASLGMGLEAGLHQARVAVEWPRGANLTRLLVVVAASVAYVVLLPFLGHPLMGTLATLAVVHMMGLASWPGKIALSLVVGAGSYCLFAVVLGVPLPLGVWFG